MERVELERAVTECRRTVDRLLVILDPLSSGHSYSKLAKARTVLRGLRTYLAVPKAEGE